MIHIDIANVYSKKLVSKMSSNKHGFDLNFEKSNFAECTNALAFTTKLGIRGDRTKIHVVTETFLCEQNLKKMVVGLNISFHYESHKSKLKQAAQTYFPGQKGLSLKR